MPEESIRNGASDWRDGLIASIPQRTNLGPELPESRSFALKVFCKCENLPKASGTCD